MPLAVDAASRKVLNSAERWRPMRSGELRYAWAENTEVIFCMESTTGQTGNHPLWHGSNRSHGRCL